MEKNEVLLIQLFDIIYNGCIYETRSIYNVTLKSHAF